MNVNIIIIIITFKISMKLSKFEHKKIFFFFWIIKLDFKQLNIYNQN